MLNAFVDCPILKAIVIGAFVVKVVTKVLTLGYV